MSLAGRVLIPSTTSSKILYGALLVLAMGVGCLSARGQTVLVPPVQIGEEAPSVGTASSNLVGSANAPLLARPAGATTYPLEYGPLHFHPHLAYQFVWADGLLAGTNNSATTRIQTISPGVFTELGRHWNLDASASFNQYSSKEFSDNTGIYIALSGHVPREDWTWNFGYKGTRTDETQVETGTQILQWEHLATASGHYFINARLSLEVNGTGDMRLTDDSDPTSSLSDSYTASTLEWLNFRATTHTTFGIGAGGGYTLLPGSRPGEEDVDWVFENLKARIVWQPGPKLTAQISGGGQWQQFFITNANNTLVPVYAGNIVYQLFESTTLGLTASREVEASYQRDRYTEATVVRFSVRQRLFKNFYLSVQPSYDLRSYRDTFGDHAEVQKDKYLSVYTSLSTTLFKKLHLSAFYVYSDNNSTQDTLSFQSDQVGFRVDYRY